MVEEAIKKYLFRENCRPATVRKGRRQEVKERFVSVQSVTKQQKPNVG